jgi:thioesterase domain-containing protein
MTTTTNIKTFEISHGEKEFTFESLVFLKPKGNKVPIFIVHGANYDVKMFNNLAKVVDKEQPVYALQAKGINGASKPHETVEEMASHYISEITMINKKGPFILGGFSFGGIIAFEMAKQLKSQGKKVELIALFDSYVYPTYYYSNPLMKKGISIVYKICQLAFIGLNMFGSIHNFNRRVKLLKIKFKGLYLSYKHGSEKQSQLQFNRSSKVDVKHNLASHRYHLTPHNLQVDLFRSTKEIYFAHDYKYLGWKSIALNGVRKHVLPGNHSEMFFPPVVEELGEKLQKVLDGIS